jgi:GTP-binding protein HflX
LKPSQAKRLLATYRRRVEPEEVASPELARHLTELSRETGRQVGVLVNRRGEVEFVIVGDAFKLEMPEIGRARAGEGRLRGLRLVHTHLKDEPLTRDDLTDLALLRLDSVAAIQALPSGLPGRVDVGWLSKPGEQAATTLEGRLVPAPDAEAAPERTSRGGRKGPTTTRGPQPWQTKSAADLFSLDFDPLATAEELEASFAREVNARPVAPEGVAMLVSVATKGRAAAESSLEELKELARTAGVEVVDTLIQGRPQLDSRYVVGEGKLEELNLRAMQLMVDMIIFDHDLTPSQSRHLGEHTSMKVLDRTQLILDIFARRAQSADGKLQVELAQLQYMLPRLTMKDDALSRLTGGIGGRGPGETKLEVDKRRVRERINLLEKRIDELSADRAVRRQKRDRGNVPVISIVGYTNAGKSTLLNSLTNSSVLAEDKLFATLDTTSRRLKFPRDREVVLTDTVGFIRALPRTLVNAFRATLEELDDADLLLHVVDVSDGEFPQQIVAVEQILASLGLSERARLLVFNKADRMPPGVASTIAHARGGVAVSATSGAGFPELIERAESMLWRDGKVAAPGAQPFESPRVFASRPR